MYTVTLTEGERNALLQLIDLAVKAGGVNVAGAGSLLYDRVSKASLLEEEIIESEAENKDEKKKVK